MEQLIFFGEIVVIGLLSVLLGLIFQIMMQKNMIFFPWAVLLAYLASKNEVWRHLTRPFGRCRYCNTTWITMYVYMYFKQFELPMLLSIAVSISTLCLLVTYIFKDINPNEQAEEYLDLQWKFLAMHETPVKPMLITYAIIGSGYAITYLVIPFIVSLF